MQLDIKKGPFCIDVSTVIILLKRSMFTCHLLRAQLVIIICSYVRDLSHSNWILNNWG